MPVGKYKCTECDFEKYFETDSRLLPDTVKHPGGSCNGNCRFSLMKDTIISGTEIPH